MSKVYKLPDIKFQQSDVYTGIRNTKGQLCNIYTPLQNYVESKTQLLGDFTTPLLNFDLQHPVDIMCQDAYDGGVNMIINDDKNPPRLINSRFSVQEENTFKITDHIGFKDSNIYTESGFNVETLLRPVPVHIPQIEYQGLRNNGGKMSVGTYVFYFKLSDIDGNETEIVAESGIVQCHIGDINSPNTIRMGLQDENSGKSIKFKLSNIDPGFAFIKVLFERRSSGADQATVTTYHKVLHNYQINSDYSCSIEITGYENIVGIGKDELYVDYADLNSVKTQTIVNNVLLFGNVNKTEHDWEALKRLTWKIIPRYFQCNSGEIGALSSDYTDPITAKTEVDEKGFCYYNTKNIYNKVGYWPGECYKFGIVYIFNDNSLSPVMNLQGIDFNLVSRSAMSEPSISNDQASTYAQLFFTEQSNDYEGLEYKHPEYLYESEDGYFNTKYQTNSKGVIRFPEGIQCFEQKDGNTIPKPLYIAFDFSLIGYKYANPNASDLKNPEIINRDWKSVLKQHSIKGYFFVRQKRVPTIISQGVVIAHSDKDRGCLPLLLSLDQKPIVQPFLGQDRLLYEDSVETRLDSFDTAGTDYNAMLVPDAELHQATFNQIFNSQQLQLEKVGQLFFNHEDRSSIPLGFNFLSDKSIKAQLTHVVDGAKLITDGTNYFSAQAGSAEEAFKTADVKNIWHLTKPQDLTISTTLVRGLWGPYVGLHNLESEKSSKHQYTYGEVYNIRTRSYENKEQAKILDFQHLFESHDLYHAITHRMELEAPVIKCFRGDCYINLFTHRVNRNFTDPELPTNTKIINPACWAQNYAVRCTAPIKHSTHSNLTDDDAGWYIDDGFKSMKKERAKQALIYFLTGNFIGAILQLTKMDDPITPETIGLGDKYINPSKVIQEDVTYISNNTEKTFTSITSNTNTYYALSSVDLDAGSSRTTYIVKLEVDDNDEPITFDQNDSRQLYPNGYANEIVNAFETYVGPSKRRNPNAEAPEANTDLSILALKYDDRPTRKKINPKEQEQNASGFNLKALFKSDENWELHGISQINRADINAVGIGQWITFPIMSSTNMAMRDVDFSNAAEEAKFNKKRSFYPLEKKQIHNPLADSSVINGAASVSLPGKHYYELPKTPFFKQEFFTRVYNSYRDSSDSITNQFRLILENAYFDYTKTHGSITKLVTMGNYVYIIFTHGIGVIDMTNLNGKTALEFLPELTIIHQDFGSMWKDSIIKTDQGIFGVDSVAKKIWLIQGTQVTVISDMKVQKFLNDNLEMSEFIFRPYVGHINIKSHYNKFKEDVMFTYYNDILYDMEDYIGEEYSVDNQGYITKNNVRITKNNNFVPAYRLLPSWDKDNQTWVSYEALMQKHKNYKWVKGVEWSLCYNLRLNQFVTFYDWIPLESENIDNIYFSFDRDGIEELKKEKYRILAPKYISKDNTDVFDVSLGIPTNKHLIDSSFTNIIFSYPIRKDYNLKVSFDKLSDKTWFACYLQSDTEDKSSITVSIKVGSTEYIETLEKQDVYFLKIPIETAQVIEIQSEDSFLLAEPKSVLCMPLEYLSDGTLKSKKSCTLVKSYKGTRDYDFRNSDNSLYLWKHGQAGVYDNQEPIKPTKWYGKQREFNFEFVVNDSPHVQKIFNNLKIVSNKTQPNKFEYEIVGEGYDWYKYKPFIIWANAVDPTNVLRQYTMLVTTPLKILQSQYMDSFPDLRYQFDYNKPLSKVPYITLQLTDRVGRQDRSYHSTDKWESMKTPSATENFNFSLNSVETVLVEDVQLNEQRIRTEQLGNDMSRFGRIRGNMQYLEDLWNIEIRPVSIKWVYSPSYIDFTSDNVDCEVLYNSTSGIPSQIQSFGTGDIELFLLANAPSTIGVECDSGDLTYGTSTGKTITIVLKPGQNKITLHGAGCDLIKFSFPPTVQWCTHTKLFETRHRDKYIKVKVRYSGEDLALIQQIYTIFEESYA